MGIQFRIFVTPVIILLFGAFATLQLLGFSEPCTDSKISQLEKLVREKDAAYARLLQQKAEQKERLERKIESERSSYRYLNSRLRETEEELDRERGKSCWDKFREKHHLRLPKKKYRSCYYTRKSFADWFAEKMLFPLGCVIFVVVVFAILIHFDLIWYMW